MTAIQAPPNAPALASALTECREHTEQLCASLSPEDCMLQGAPFASPPKWHLAHTTWFFDTFILEPAGIDTGAPAIWGTLFNSYYNGIGNPHARHERGLLSRPSLEEILNWRQRVTGEMTDALLSGALPERVFDRVMLGIQHEMQHQELLLTDLLYSFSRNPSRPIYDGGGYEGADRDTVGTGRSDTSIDASPAGSASTPAKWDSDDQWLNFESQLTTVGASDTGFSFDNERPAFRHFLEPFAMGKDLVSNRDYRAFIDDGGYRDPQWWLADGWTLVCAEQWQRPLHWLNNSEHFSLQGVRSIDGEQPVMHLSGYEADAYARWADARLPTEFEWEHAARACAPAVVPSKLAPDSSSGGWFGSVWQWTQSAYSPYPGFQTAPGAVGEYNGKFMSNQWVLRGGSFVTHPAQQRISYRNFFYPSDRWQFTGLRLARSRTK